MNEPRIAFDARYIHDRYHGIGRFAFWLLETMIQSAPQNTFVVFRGQGRDTRFSLDSLRQYANVELRDGPWPLYWPQEQLQWARLLKETRANLFLSPYFVAPLLVKIPVIITVHDLIFDHYPETMPMRWTRPYYRLMMTQGLRRAAKVLAVSQATAADLQQMYRIHPGKIVVTSESAEGLFQPVEDQQQLDRVRRSYNLEQAYFLSVGARRPHKNFHRLVEAFARVAPGLPHDLVFAGPADSRFPDEARQTAARLGLADRVRFLDWVPDADLPALYTLAQGVVVPSLIEGFGLPALEAMACGAPVAAANTSSLPEVVGAAGLLFDPLNVDEIAAALQKLAGSKTLRRCYSTAGRLRAGLFTWKFAAAQALFACESGLSAFDGNPVRTAKRHLTAPG